MKTTRNIWSLLLLGSIAAAGCSDYVEENAPRNKTITTQLAIAVPQAKTTRMSVEATQSDETFRGMKDITLLPFSVTSAATAALPVPSTATRVGDAISLGTLAVADIHTQNHSHLYDLSLTVGINAFLAYGRSSAATTGINAVGLGLADGETAATTPAGISFSPVPFVESVEEGKAASEKGDAIIAYLNTIFTADWANTENSALYSLYDMVKAMQAGSSASVLAFVNKIYEVLLPSKGDGTTKVDAALKAILAVETLPETMPASVTALPESCQGFPADVKLPDGAAVIQWNETSHAFEAVTTKNNFNGLNVDVTQFAYPAELWYRANSLVNTDDASKAAYYQSEATWDAVLAAYTNKPGTVMLSTKSVAVRHQMQYGVALLDVKVTASDESLVDRANNEIPVSTLAITGVLVGSQAPVDYNFNAQALAEGAQSYTIYDGNITTGATINASDFAHTLTFETLQDEKVNVAVEFQNNSEVSIVTGSDETIVPPGCKFYLVGQLDPANPATSSATAAGKALAQDHVTQVTFTVSNLKNAYYVIPTLTSGDLSFSLGVIDWKLSTPASVLLK